MKLKFLSALLFSTILVSCDKCKTADEPVADYSQGAFIVNEGSFGNLNGSVTWTLNGVLVSNPFADANGTALGDVISDFDVVNGKFYAISNSTSKIIVMNATTFKVEAEITGFTYPRSFQFIGNGMAAVTDGSLDGSVKWIDLSTNTITASTPVGLGPEGMCVYADRLYVCNSGGWDIDNRVTVIDIPSQSVLTNVTVADRPVEVQADATGNLWVLCSGQTQYDANWTQIIGHTPAALAKVNTLDNSVTTFDVGVLGDHPLHMAKDETNNKIYIANNTVLSFDMQTSLMTDFLTTSSNGVSVNPTNHEVYVCSETNYASPSNVKVYSSMGTYIKEIPAGIAAWKVEFN
jgi:DNA-binding beta-propeller fold protein YncE